MDSAKGRELRARRQTRQQIKQERKEARAKEQEAANTERAKVEEREKSAKRIRLYINDELNIEPQDSDCLLLNMLDEALLLRILAYLAPKDLLLLTCICRKLWKLSLEEQLWKPLAIERWSELEMATQVDDWNFLYRRKHSEKATEYKDLMKEFQECDWYACPNGHVYLIGECRLPMTMANCATCGAKIGGKSHMMLSTNERIGAVDNYMVADAMSIDGLQAGALKGPQGYQPRVDTFDEEAED